MKKLLLLFIPLVLFSCSTGVSNAEIEELEKKIQELEEQLKQYSSSSDEWDADDIAYKDFTGDWSTKTVKYTLTKKSGSTGIVGQFKYNNSVLSQSSGGPSGYTNIYLNTEYDFSFFNNSNYEIYYKYTQTKDTNGTTSTISIDSTSKCGRYKLYEYNENYGIIALYKYDSYVIFDTAYFYYMSDDTLYLISALNGIYPHE